MRASWSEPTNGSDPANPLTRPASLSSRGALIALALALIAGGGALALSAFGNRTASAALIGLQVLGLLSCTFALLRTLKVHRRIDASLVETRRELEWLRATQGSVSERVLVLQRAARLGYLTPIIAHEINNAMSYITSNVKMLATDLSRISELPAELREYGDDLLPATVNGIRRVNSLVSDLHRFARAQDVEVVEYDLNAEVEAAHRLLCVLMKRRGRVDLELGDIPLSLGHPGELRQMLVELIVNAINAAQAAPEGGIVRVSTRLEQEELVVAISDNGPGMTEQVQSHLFQPFFSTRPAGQGCGLGLLFAKQVVSEHRGRIDVQSAPGEGSCFTVRIPYNPRIPKNREASIGLDAAPNC